VITLDFGTTLWPPRPAIEQAEHSVVDVTPPFLRAPRNDAT
jgi:hypothetical protein